MEKEAEKKIQDESIQNLYEAYNKLKLQHEQMVGAIRKDEPKKREQPLEKVLRYGPLLLFLDTFISILSVRNDGLCLPYCSEDRKLHLR